MQAESLHRTSAFTRRARQLTRRLLDLGQAMHRIGILHILFQGDGHQVAEKQAVPRVQELTNGHVASEVAASNQLNLVQVSQGPCSR